MATTRKLQVFGSIKGVGISSIEQTTVPTESGDKNIVTFTLDDGTKTDVEIQNGKSAYEYAKEIGYEGTEEEFAAKLAEELTYEEKVEMLEETGYKFERYLTDGKTFNSLIPAAATKVIFTDEIAPVGADLTDLSLLQDESIVAWLDDTTWKVSTQVEGGSIIATECEQMFFSTKLKCIDLSLLDTSNAQNFYQMFMGSTLLEELDLRNVNIDNATSTIHWISFVGSESTKVYVKSAVDAERFRDATMQWTNAWEFIYPGLPIEDKEVTIDNHISDKVTVYASVNKADNTATITVSPINRYIDAILSFTLDEQEYTGTNCVVPLKDTTTTLILSGVHIISIDNQSADLISVKFPYSGAITLGVDRLSVTTVNTDNILLSYKINGKIHYSNTFIIPEDVGETLSITDAIVSESTIIESEHNPYPNNLNVINEDGTIGTFYGEAKYDGAVSLKINLTMSMQGTTDKVYMYDAANNIIHECNYSISYTRTTTTLDIPGDYVKITFSTDSSNNSAYGFRAVITPIYPVELEIDNQSSDICMVHKPDTILGGKSDVVLIPTNGGVAVKSFVLNGEKINGNAFRAPLENSSIIISDVEVFTIINQCENIIDMCIPTTITFDFSYVGIIVDLIAKESLKIVSSYKVNGIDCYGNSLIITNELDASIVISDVCLDDGFVIETPHYPVVMNNKWQTNEIVYELTDEAIRSFEKVDTVVGFNVAGMAIRTDTYIFGKNLESGYPLYTASNIAGYRKSIRPIRKVNYRKYISNNIKMELLANASEPINANDPILVDSGYGIKTTIKINYHKPLLEAIKYTIDSVENQIPKKLSELEVDPEFNALEIANQNSLDQSYSPVEDSDLVTKGYVDGRFITDEEAVQLLVETGYFNVVTDEEDNIITDENGDIVIV